MTRRAAFLDSNGTLVVPVMVERLADLHLIDAADAAIARVSAASFACPASAYFTSLYALPVSMKHRTLF